MVTSWDDKTMQWPLPSSMDQDNCAFSDRKSTNIICKKYTWKHLLQALPFPVDCVRIEAKTAAYILGFRTQRLWTWPDFLQLSRQKIYVVLGCAEQWENINVNKLADFSHIFQTKCCHVPGSNVDRFQKNSLIKTYFSKYLLWLCRKAKKHWKLYYVKPFFGIESVF